MSSMKPDQVNRVKSITSKFEDLNGQVSTQTAKSNVNRDLPVQKAHFGRLKNDPCCENHLPGNRVLNGNNNAKDKFGPSCNFGNRKRLKDQNDKEILKKSNEKLNLSHSFPAVEGLRVNRVKNEKSFDYSVINDNSETSNGSKVLSRQYSDPVKKLQRTPAFRCDRSEKISRSSLSKSPELQKQSERFHGREKLKKLGSMIEERLREDNLTFTGMSSKTLVDCNDKLDNNCNEERNGFDTTNIDNTKKSPNNSEPEQIVSSIVEDSLDEAFVAEMKRSDNSIPQHVLDMYAKVLKPKTRCGIFSKSDFLSKSDAVFSDSGVSSESENLISDDLEDSRICNDNVFVNEKESAEVDPLLRSTTQNLSSSSNDDTLSLDEFVALNGKNVIISGVASADTLKKVFQQPLPPGPPPKKPPRTFATSSSPVSPKKIPTKVPNKIQIDSKFKLKSPNNKNKPHRSKEESKLMLDKIESALIKHKHGGKVLSPRLDANRAYEPVTFFNDRVQTTVGDSISTTSTQPSTVRLRQASKKVDKGNATDKKPEEIHYMCTEILDLHFSDKNCTANLSNDSISSEIVQPSSSLVNCFNSLNCVSGNDKNYSIFYSKFGSAPNSTNTSFVDVCCYCNSKDKKCQNGQSDSTVRLSTFFNPNKSLDRTEHVKCKRCCINETKETNFKCHLDCKCAGDTVENGIGNSSFFREIPGDTGQYGALVKSKSQEHIYDEPANVIKDLDEIRSRNDESCMKRSMFTRSATQLEDSFNRFRARSMIENIECEPADNSTLNRFVRNEFKSKTMDRVKSDSRDHKVKDILKLVEFNKKKNYTKRTSVADEIDNKPDKSSENENGDNGREKLQLFKKSKQLHYMCSNIYDTTPAETSPLFGRNSSEMSIAEADFEPGSDITDKNKRNSSEMSHSLDRIVPNASALYNKHISKEILQRLNKDSNVAVRDDGLSTKKPPIFERKVKDVSNRPQNLEVRGETSTPSNLYPLTRNVIGPKNETDKRNLDQLMTEIYDTVTAICMVESPTKEGKMLPDEFHKNADVGALNSNDKDMTEASLKLSRSLTEKRKKYVRRVSSRTGLITPISVGSIKRNRQSLDVYENRTSDDITLSLPTKYDFKKVKAVFEQDVIPVRETPIPNKVAEIEQNLVKRDILSDKDRLFEVCALIGMNFSTGQAYIKSVYPENAMLPPQIESLVFPESLDCNEENAELLKNSRKYERVRLEIPPEYTQTYSLVLTDERGNRSYGYCRRVVPEGEPFCLPLAYCIISPHRIPSFYYKVLLEIEMHYGSSEIVVNSILDQLYNEKLPHAGNCISFKQIKTPKKLGSFKKNSLCRSTVNLGDVFKNVSNIGAQKNQSDSLENLSQIKFNSNNSLRRKSADLSLKFPDVFGGANGKQMIKSLEKMYAEEFKDYQDVLKADGGFYSELKRSTLNVNENCFEREFGSKTNLAQGILSHPLNLKRVDVPNSRKFSIEKKSSDCDILEYYDEPIELKRPLELRLEEDNLSILFECISVDLLVKIFGTLLLERKVIIVGDKLSQLSSCIEALQSILYPFIWQHTIISTIPSYLRRDILDTPMPILAGVLCTKLPDGKRKKSTPDKHSSKAPSPKLGQPSDANSNFYITDSNEVGFNRDDFYDEIKSSNFEEGMIIDITSNNNMPSDRVIKVQNDESTLLPPVLSKKLRAALQIGPSISTSGAKSENHARKSRNILIAEAFLRFFTDLLGDYRDYLTIESSPNSTFYNDGICKKQNFDKESFIKSASTKHVQFFLEWFTETAMFSNFISNKSQIEIKERLPYPSFYHLFDERISLLETTQSQMTDSTSKNEKHDSGSNVKNNYKLKLKTWRDKLRDLIN